MTNRILRFKGYGFGATDATVKVTFDGVEVFNGAVTTTSDPIPLMPNPSLASDVVVLFTVETVPVSFSGTKPMTYEVTNGTVVFADIESNYMLLIPNPVYSAEEFATLTSDTATRAEKLAIMAPHAVPAFNTADESTILNSSDYNEINVILAAHGCSLFVSSGPDRFDNTDQNGPVTDPRTNVTIDGVAPTIDRGDTLNGTWYWVINEGSTLSCDVEISAGHE